MSKRLLCALALVFFVSAFAAGQQVKRARPGRAVRPPAGAAVTVIDLRNVGVNKKPPKREAEPPYSLRMKPGARTNVTALNAVQLSQALKGAGVSVPPPNVYARLSPSEISLSGKAYLFLLYPSEVYPDRVGFESSMSGNHAFSQNGARVMLNEVGTYVIDFLVEFPGPTAGQSCQCEVSGGLGVYQLQEVFEQPGPQHILVVVGPDALGPAQDEWQRSIGIRFYQPAFSDRTVSWMLHLVDITKL